MAETDVPNWYTSPTYPPQTDYDTDPRISRVVKSDHPGLVDMLAEFPDSALATYVNANCALGTDADCLYYRGRPFGASGPGETRGSRNYKTNRLVLALDGSRGDIDYTTSFTYSTSEGNNRSYDTITERWSAAIEGLGGPNCDRATGTPGAGDCYYYNPFTNAIQYGQQKYTSYTAGNPNPNYNADVANNTDVLIPWMTEPLGSKVDSELTVFDAVFTGPGFSDMVSWAAGIQLRSENYDIAPLATTDLNQYPCRTDAENTEFRNSGRTYSNAQGTDNCAGADGIFGGAMALLMIIRVQVVISSWPARRLRRKAKILPRCLVSWLFRQVMSWISNCQPDMRIMAVQSAVLSTRKLLFATSWQTASRCGALHRRLSVVQR